MPIICREWIWHGRLENDPALQAAIIGAAGGEGDWNVCINTGPLGYSVDGLFVVLEGGGVKSVTRLLQSVRTFWTDLFTRYPQLG
jgi:hypothetical protein